MTTDSAEPTATPDNLGWVWADLARHENDEAISPLLQRFNTAIEARDWPAALAAAAALVQAQPSSVFAYHLTFVAAQLAGDVALARAMVERLFVRATHAGNREQILFYGAAEEELCQGLDDGGGYRIASDYVSCEWIESGLAFNPTTLHVCCIPNQGSKGGWEAVGPYSEDVEPDVVAIMRVRQHLRHAAQSGGTERCRGCSNLQRRSWKRPFLLETLNFSHFQRCNLRCNYCYLEQPGFVPDEKAMRDPNRLIAHLRFHMRHGLLSPEAIVYWGGGEPTLLRDFEELVGALSEHGCRNLINTNGIKFSTVLESALRRGNTMVVCSLDSGTTATYRRKKGADVYQRVLDHCRHYAAASQGTSKTALKYIVDSDNIAAEDLQGFIAAVGECGITEVVLDVNSSNSFFTEEMTRAMATLQSELTSRGVNAFLGGCGLFGFPELDVRRKVDAKKAELDTKVASPT